MNNSEQQPRTLEEAETIVGLYDALTRIEKTSDFKLIFEEHLLTNEVIRLHSLMAHPDASMVASREAIIKDLDALSGLRVSLQMIKTIGAPTKEQLDEFREAQALSESGGEL